jgi:hypothetical protein
MKIDKLSYFIFGGLILLAPLSKVPSVALPVLGFVSFRIGMYQVLAAIFVLVSAKSVYTNRSKLATRSNLGFKLCLLLVCMAIGTIGAISLKRNLLLGSSFILLLGVAISAYDLCAKSWKDLDLKRAEKYMLYACIVYGTLSILHLAFVTYAHSRLLLCTGCVDSVFGFPRVNVFAAEPLFWANALLPFFAVALHSVYVKNSRIAQTALALVSVGVGLTFARGAYATVVIGMAVFFVQIRRSTTVNPKLVAQTIGLVIAGFASSWMMLVISSSQLHRSTPDIAYTTLRSMVEHATFGVVKLPVRASNPGIPPATPTVPLAAARPIVSTDFVPKGLVVASTAERSGSAKLAIKTMQHDGWSLLFGVGFGNLGLSARRYVDPQANPELTVYIYYVLFAAEMGLVGLVALMSIYWSALRRLLKLNTETSRILVLITVMFLVQYATFGSYINVVYVWLWLGLALGYGVQSAKHEHKKTSTKAVKKVSRPVR